jgi:hypothetical protein
MPETGNKLVIDTAKTLLLPGELYEPGTEAEYLRFNGMEPAEGEVAVASPVVQLAGVPGGIVAVMAVKAEDVGSVESVGSVGDNVTSPLLMLVEAAFTGAKKVAGGKRSVNIFLTRKNAYLVVREKRLEMAEVFPDTSPDSLLYYMQVIGRRFALNRFEIVVSGERAQEAASMLGGYFRGVRVR